MGIEIGMEQITGYGTYELNIFGNALAIRKYHNYGFFQGFDLLVPRDFLLASEGLEG